jgi:hypothetical protein
LLSAQARIDPTTAASILLLLLIVVVALFLNRFGKQTPAALVLIAGMDLVVEGALLSAGQRGGLGAGWLLTFDLFIIPLITVGLLLSRRYLPFFAALHIGLILGDYYLLPHTSDLIALVLLWNGDSIAFARPILIQIGGALLSFVAVRSTDEAIRRADRAEEVAQLEHAFAEQRRQLEIGAQQILETHVRIANGDYTARAPLTQDNVLWQIAASLNNLLTRLQRSGQAEHQLRRTEDELRRLATAIDDAQAGRRPIWPVPTGTAADLIIERVSGRSRPPAGQGMGGSTHHLPQPPMGNRMSPGQMPSMGGTPPMPAMPDLGPWPALPDSGTMQEPWGNQGPNSGGGRSGDLSPENPWFLPSENQGW